MRDHSTNGLHGTVTGQTAVTQVAWPVVVSGKITDAAGRGLSGAAVEILQPGRPVRSLRPNNAGEYAFTAYPGEPCDLFVTSGELSAYRLDFHPGTEPSQRLDWTLGDPGKAPVELGGMGTPAVPARSGSESSGNSVDFNPPSASGAAANGDRSQSTPFPPGTVVATVLTDEQGDFEFPNVPPGAYQVRAQIPGGRAWYDAGRILFADPDATEAERARLAKLDFQLAPFNKGRWKKFGVLDGLKNNSTGRTLFTSDGALWNHGAGGFTRFDGREFFPLSSEKGLAGLVQLPFGRPPGCQRHVLDGNQRWPLALPPGGRRSRPPASRRRVFLPPTFLKYRARRRRGLVAHPDALVRYQGGQGTVFTNLWREPELGFEQNPGLSPLRAWPRPGIGSG